MRRLNKIAIFLALMVFLFAARLYAATIEGTVLPVPQSEGTKIEVYSVSDWQYYASAYSGPDGGYAIGGLAEGSYKVKAVPPSSTDLQIEWYGGGIQYDEAAAVVITESAPGIANFTLNAGATRISGTVLDPDGLAVLSGEVKAVFNKEIINTAPISAGAYELTNLPPTIYRIWIEPPTSWSAQFYGPGTPLAYDDAERVDVSAGNAANIDFILVPAYPVSGWVYQSVYNYDTGQWKEVPISDIMVRAYYAGEDRGDKEVWGIMDSSDIAGIYTLRLPSGTWKLAAGQGSTYWAVRFYAQRMNWKLADIVFIVDEGVVGIDFRLERGASIIGYARDAADGSIINQELPIQFWGGRGLWKRRKFSGNFHLGGLSQGIGEVSIRPEINSAYVWYVRGIYFPPGETAYRDFFLRRGRPVTIRLEDPSAVALPDVRLDIDGRGFDWWGRTDENGEVHVLLPAGYVYGVVIDQDEGDYECLTGFIDDASPAAITLVGHSRDAAPQISGQISGTLPNIPGRDTAFFMMALTTEVTKENFFSHTANSFTEFAMMEGVYHMPVAPNATYNLFHGMGYSATGSGVDSPLTWIVFGDPQEVTVVNDNVNAAPFSYYPYMKDKEITGVVTYQGEPLLLTGVNGNNGAVFLENATGRLVGASETDENGRYHFYNLDAGTYILTAYSFDHGWSTSDQVVLSGALVVQHDLSIAMTQDEYDIRQLYTQIETLWENKDLAGILSHISGDYLEAGKDKTDFANELTGTFNQFETIGLNFIIGQVEVSGNSALAEIIIEMTGRDAQGRIIEYAKDYKREYLRKETGAWRLFGDQRRLDVDIALDYNAVDSSYYAVFSVGPKEITAIALDDAGMPLIGVQGWGITASPDFVWDGESYLARVEFAQGYPEVGEVYSISVTYSDSSQQTFYEAIRGRVDAGPQISSPNGNIMTTTPLISWQDLSAAVQDPAAYKVRVLDGGQFDSAILWESSQPLSVLSLTYNFDETGTALSYGNTYYLQVSISDVYGNTASYAMQFEIGTYIVLSEIMAYSTSGEEWVELYNTSAEPVDIGGSFIKDEAGNERPLGRIAAGTNIAANGYYVIEVSNADDVLDNAGDTIYLMAADGVTVLDFYAYGLAGDADSSFSYNGALWYVDNTPTKGLANDDPTEVAAGQCLISGYAYDQSTGSALSGINIWVEPYAGGPGQGASTMANGYYYINNIAPGDYRVGAGGSDNYFVQWYNNRISYTDADHVVLAANERRGGIDFSLAAGGTISGYVYQQDAVTPIADEAVVASMAQSPWIGWSSRTVADGSYTIIVPFADYVVFSGGEGSGYLREVYREHINWDDADIVSVTAKDPEALNVNFTLEQGTASVSGTVFNDNRVTRLGDIPLSYESDLYDLYQETASDNAEGPAKGRYGFLNLPRGLAEVIAEPDVDTGYAELSKDIYLAAGESLNDLDFYLQPGALIRGQLTVAANGAHPNGVEIDAYGGHFNAGWAQSQHSDSPVGDGYYQMRLVPGDYTIGVFNSDEYIAWPQALSVSNPAEGQDVDITLYRVPDDCALVSGNITVSAAAQAGSVFMVLAFPAGTANGLTPGEMIPEAISLSVQPGGSGQYNLAVVPNQSYDIVFALYNENEEGFEAVTIIGSAADIAVDSAKVVGPDFSFDNSGGEISGAVSANGESVLMAMVTVFDSNGKFVGFADSDQNGAYHIYNLPPGDYTAYADHQDYCLSSAVAVSVPDGIADISLGWVLNMTEMPWRQNEQNYYTGAASSEMILDYICAGPGAPDPTQADIYNYAHPAADGLELTPDEVDLALGHFDPYDTLVSGSYDSYDTEPGGNSYQGYNFSVSSYDSQQPGAINDYMRDICYWMAYTVPQWHGGPLVARPNTPAAVPIFGDIEGYNHWVAITGLAASTNPNPEPLINPPNTPDFTIYGFWLKDPLVSGIGKNRYATADECMNTYFKPLNTTDAYNGRYVQVAEPPAEMSTAKVRLARPVKRSEQVGASGNSTGERLLFARPKKQDLNYQDIVASPLLTDPEAARAFKNTEPQPPILVHRLDRAGQAYCLIPYQKARKTDVETKFRRRPLNLLTSAVVITDAEDGYFKEASWTKSPTSYSLISRAKAIEQVRAAMWEERASRYERRLSHIKNRRLRARLLRYLKRGLRLWPDFRRVEARRVWAPGAYSSSPYWPFWEIKVDGATWYVTQEGKTYRAD